MSSTADLQAFLGKIEQGTVAVDLLKIGQSYHQQHSSTSKKNSKHNNGKFRVALDIEDCLDRFYGGYYSDWACGGQWNRAYQFVQLLANAFSNAHIEVTAFFDGSLKKNKKLSFERNDFRTKTNSVLKHIRMIGTPPPKIWWLPPSGIRTTLRNALRSINIQVAQTINDHTMEVIEYFHEHKLDAILGLHPDYIVANISRYFSSHDLRLSYKGSLETKEFMVSKLLSSLSLTADHLPFVAVFLGGYILIDDVMLKKIYELFKIDASLDYEGKIRKIAEIVRNSPTNDIDEFIKHLSLADFEKEIKESVEYYQRKDKYSSKKYLMINKKKTNSDSTKSSVTVESVPLASETSETDEIGRKILNDVKNLVEDETSNGASAAAVAPPPAESGEKSTTTTTTKGKNNEKDGKKSSPTPFIYTLPGEVLKTSLNRHQRGIMDPRIYQILTRKEIILPQILEDEKYREIPSVHLFYRPARQMIYAILFNMYHQKYLCSRQNTSASDKKDEKKENKKNSSQKPPEIQISEWIWSPQNEYKKPEMVTAQPLPWAVPTIQRLWFGMTFEDKQRRMKAFLSIMRSDSPLMLNRGYVPQHMLVMACVLRYIVTSPDRNILTRQELDAFLATAFSPQLTLVEYTQELVLPGVHLRGVYLATLFMQGVETASLANDSCGVPLPWTMTNPWLFFDGKLFHLKLKMSTYVATLRELCDDHIEIVLKIERFRKAILEDVEHYLLPAAHMVTDPMYRPGFLPQPAIPVAYNKGGLHQLAAATSANGTIFYNPQAQLQTPSYFSASAAVLGRAGLANVNSALASNRNQGRGAGQNRSNANNRKGYQLKVGGIVTGSWAAGGIANRTLIGPPGNRLGNRAAGGLARFAINNRGRTSVNARLQRNQQQNTNNIASRSIARAYGNKINSRNRTKQKRKDNRKTKQSTKKDSKDDKEKTKSESTDDSNDNDNDKKKSSSTKTDNSDLEKTKNDSGSRQCTVELQNGSTVFASDLVTSMWDNILKDDDDKENTTKSTDKANNKKEPKQSQATASATATGGGAPSSTDKYKSANSSPVKNSITASTTSSSGVNSSNNSTIDDATSDKGGSGDATPSNSAKHSPIAHANSKNNGGKNISFGNKKIKAKKNGTIAATAAAVVAAANTSKVAAVVAGSVINDTKAATADAAARVEEIGQGDVPVKG